MGTPIVCAMSQNPAQRSSFISKEEFEEMERQLLAVEEQYKDFPLAPTAPKTRKDVLDDIIGAHVLMGGKIALAQWGLENKDLFYTKVLPRALPSATQEVHHSGEINIKHVLPRTTLDNDLDIDEGEFTDAKTSVQKKLEPPP